MTQDRQYYSVRRGENPNADGLGLSDVLNLFLDVFDKLEGEGYFQQYLGYYIQTDLYDYERIDGEIGNEKDIQTDILIKVRKGYLWPIDYYFKNYSENDFFDMVEYLNDHASKCINRKRGNFKNDCDGFDLLAGQQEYRKRINKILNIYDVGYELNVEGYILSLPDAAYKYLLDAKLPANNPENISQKLEQAKLKFRRARSTLSDRKDAIRDLADIFENLRLQVQAVLTKKDEGALFNITNNFHIRHDNDKQKSSYDRNIWYSWMFYFYLSTIHASIRLIEKSKNDSNPNSQ